jgi:hypothetical protein
METRFKGKQAARAGFLTCLFLICGFARDVAAQTVPTMTIKIYNDSDHHSIYPVLSTGGHSPHDLWLQAIFAVPKPELASNPYPSPDTFRLYVNPEGAGIPPHGSITITLPLYTQLVPNGRLNPKVNNQYIDWWNGGRISIYESPSADATPPEACRQPAMA